MNPVDQVSQEQLYDFVFPPNTKKTKYVDANKKKKWLKLIEKSNKKTWFVSMNWAVFFWGANWFLYRNMGGFAILYTILKSALYIFYALLLSFLVHVYYPALLIHHDLFKLGDKFFATIMVALTLCPFANAIYLRNAKRKIIKKQEAYFAGTESWFIVLIGAILLLIVAILTGAFLMGIIFGKP